MSDVHNPHESGSKSTAALWERVENHGSLIRSLAEETASQFRDFRSEIGQQIGGLVASIKEVNTKFDVSAARAAESQRPQYLGLFGAAVGAVGLSVTIMVTLSGLHDRPVDNALTDQRQLIADLTKNTRDALDAVAKSSVSQAEYKITSDFTNRMSDFKTQVATDRANRIQAQADGMAKDLVPRTEHQFHWDAEAKIDAHLEEEIAKLADSNRQQMAALSGRLDQLAPAGDLLKQLEQGQHELELRIYGQKPPTGN